MVVAAVANGASAMYAGPRGWSRRRHRYELPDEDIHEAIAIAHTGGAKIRVAARGARPCRSARVVRLLGRSVTCL